MKTTFARITLGFGKNKLGGSKYYRKGEGKNLVSAILGLLKQRGNNFLPEDQKKEVLKQVKSASKLINS